MHAPLFREVAECPENGAAYWVTADDGTRIRFGYWPGKSGETALILPGRAEYIEKYGRVVSKLNARGVGALVLDWRNQGLSDRAAKTGHVGDYQEYQLDFKAVLTAPAVRDLPDDIHLIAHSMGGLIALRCLAEGFSPKDIVFSAPMWGMGLNPFLHNSLKILAQASVALGTDRGKLVGANDAPYVLTTTAKDNSLMSDPEHFEWFKGQLSAHPELGLGGPSWGWLHNSHKEIKALREFDLPGIPTVTFLGSDESIVDIKSIKNRMTRRGRLVEIAGARHEVFMETPDIQTQLWQEIDALWGLSV